MDEATVIVDAGPAWIAALSAAGAARMPAAAARIGSAMVYGAAAAGAPPAAREQRLPDVIDEEFIGLSGAVLPVVDVYRGLLAHAVAQVSAARPHRLVLVLPTVWGGVRRGVVERAAASLAEVVTTVASGSAARAAAHREWGLRRDAPAGVVERWPDLVVGSLDGAGDGSAAVQDLVGSGGLDDAAAARAADAVRALPGGHSGTPVLLVPRCGRRPGAPATTAPAGVLRLDADAVLRGAALIAAGTAPESGASK